MLSKQVLIVSFELVMPATACAYVGYKHESRQRVLMA